MAEDRRKKYAEARDLILDYIRKDLIGPLSEDELLDESPRYSYITGMLAPAFSQTEYDPASEQEVSMDAANDGNDYSLGYDETDDDLQASRFKLPSSIGISFYVKPETSDVNAIVSWGEYTTEKTSYKDKDGEDKEKNVYRRRAKEETVRINLQEADRKSDYKLKSDESIHLYVSRFEFSTGYYLVTVYVINKREGSADDVANIMFQTKLTVESIDGNAVFVPEGVCRGLQDSYKDEYFYRKRPIFGRGRGCSATWDRSAIDCLTSIETDFIPEYEIPGVSPEVNGFGPEFLSTFFMATKKNRKETIKRLQSLADSYERWISSNIENNPKMSDQKFADAIGNETFWKCRNALARICKGIKLLADDDTAFEAFCFMNYVIFMQNAIKRYSDGNRRGIVKSWNEYKNPTKSENLFGWRPFQIAFILMNIAGISYPQDEDRDIVDLLYFPTGGGKTEAYLGLMAYTIADRRLRRDIDDGYERDGGVTIMLRYTLRLLTTQQRDRILRMIIAAEMIRHQSPSRFGSTPISIGFWVGGGVTPNKFDELKKNESGDYNKVKILHQVPVCPFCGEKLSEDYIFISPERNSIEIYCPSEKSKCIFSHEHSAERVVSIPVHLVDEEIYSACPTVILGTVDKFARLPWDEKTGTLFGKVDRYCERDGFVAQGALHKSHKRRGMLPPATPIHIRPFLPPQLIIQDELHLITGPLGTIYGAYETVIEDLCAYEYNRMRIRPKYIASTATISNAGDQIRVLYGREKYLQFPPDGLETGDSFFIREVPVDEYAFRKYSGIAAQGQSMKTTLLRVYAIILQAAYDLSQKEEWKDYIDPYYTLVGYFNSIRELGGAVRLLQDDIVKRINRLQKKFGDDKRRWIEDESRRIEITSRTPSGEIPKLLQRLEASIGERGCIDTAIATNMIAVGLDVDRLGLMVVTGQPKQTSEYIQATSRVGRKYPGFVFTVYNPYRPRDLSHYENFTGYHAELYRFVEGTTATPFSARARDRVLHALVIAAIRLNCPDLADNAAADKIVDLSDRDIEAVKKCIIERLRIVKPEAQKDASDEIDAFIGEWKDLAEESDKPLRYYVPDMEKDYRRLMANYGDATNQRDREKATLNSMRDVESPASMYYWENES